MSKCCWRDNPENANKNSSPKINKREKPRPPTKSNGSNHVIMSYEDDCDTKLNEVNPDQIEIVDQKIGSIKNNHIITTGSCKKPILGFLIKIEI